MFDFSRLYAIILSGLFAVSLAYAEPENEWQDVNYEDLGISQTEFQQVRESGMSKKKLLELLEYGILPSEYFSEPWKKLGVSERHWLSEKKAGMSNEDIDRSYRQQSASSVMPWLSFIMPGFYQYKSDRVMLGAGLTTAAVAGVGLTLFHRNKEEDNSIRSYYLILAAGAAIWSAGDAYLNTKHIDNPDARRFSFGIGLLPEGGWAGAAQINF